MVYHISNTNFYRGYNTYNKNRALAAAATVVNDSTPQQSTDLMTSIQDEVKRNPGMALIGGALSLFGYFHFKKKNPLPLIGGFALLAIGGYGYMSNGNQLFTS